MADVALQKRNELTKRINEEFESPEETIMFLMAFLDGLTRNTFSGDAMALAYYDALDTCKKIGIDEAKAKEIWSKMKVLWESRRTQLMKDMFADIGETI